MKKLFSFVLLIALLSSTLTLFTTAASYTIECGDSGVLTKNGASVRLSNESSGLRFKTNVSRSLINELSAEYGQENITIGTLIAPKDLLSGKPLRHGVGTLNVDYIDVETKINTPFEQFADYNVYAGSIVNIKTGNLTREFVATGYIKISDGDTCSYIYSSESPVRTVSYVASLAYRDVSDTLITDGYQNLITDEGDEHHGKYSPYTKHQRDLIKKLISANCAHLCEENEPQAPEQNGYTEYLCKLCGDIYRKEKEKMTLQYDDHTTKIGTISADSNSILFEGDDCLEIITKDNVRYFRAKNIGTTVVSDGRNTERVTVEKAKLHFIVVMGQSNAGCHFANAMSDVTCPIGTAYHMSSATSAPKLYTAPSTGFHTPLVAEFRAQSVAASAPEKPVLIWKEGATSKNGRPITDWATSATETSGTDATVAMIEECTKYFTAPERADKYEIVGSGMYWLQGEGGADPYQYTECFMAMWQRLKNVGVEYCAIFRVRRGVSFNKLVPDDHNDLSHHGALRAQMEMINKYDDIYLATDITENWIGGVTDTHSIDISNYYSMLEAYGKSENYADNLGNRATFKDGLLTTTMKELYGENNWCHYGKFGYGIIGADAAYNMYRALYKNNVSVIASDTSGMVGENVRTVSLAGDNKMIDIRERTHDLFFLASAGSKAGTLKLSVYADGNDITNNSGVIIDFGNHYGAISVEELKKYENVSIKVTFSTKEDSLKPITYTVIDQ